MSRPDLYDLARAHGGMRLIPEELCLAHRIGVDRVWAVLVDRMLDADPAGTTYVATRTIEARLGLPRRLIRDADQVLEEAGLLERVGTRGRAIRYRVLPRLLDAIAGDDDANPVPVAPPNGQGNGQANGQGNGQGSRPQREGKRKERGARDAHPAPAEFTEASPTPCPAHGMRGSPTPCRHCADLRKWQEGRPTTTPPPVQDVLAELELCSTHGEQGFTQDACIPCRRARIPA